jgi:hypothetical protein
MKSDNHAVLEWSNGIDLPRSTPKHLARLGANGQNFVGRDFDRHYRRLIEYDPLPAHEYECVGGAKVYSNIV